MITPLMWRVGCCECGISCDVARGAVRDHLLGYMSPSNHPYRPMSQMGSTSQVTNRDRFIHETGKGVASIGNVQDIDGHLLNLSLDVRARLGKGWKTWGNPYSRTRVWWLVRPFMWVQLYTSVVFESLKSFGTEPFSCSYFLYPCSVVNELWALMCNLDINHVLLF
jgi:hypothetical protein